jgi:peptidoglycan/xylan/chitin deacetylase (PgdA/CDA1 family)
LHRAVGFLWCSDSYADDLPYWVGPQLIIPYTLATICALRQGRASTPASSSSPNLEDSFDVLWREGERGQAKTMSVGLHCRLAGRPGRTQAVARFADYVLAQSGVWLARRIDIAHHWHAKHRARATLKNRPVGGASNSVAPDHRA